MGFRSYNARRRVHKLYAGTDRNGKTMTVTAYTKAEAVAEMRRKGFRPVGKVHQT